MPDNLSPPLLTAALFLELAGELPVDELAPMEVKLALRRKDESFGETAGAWGCDDDQLSGQMGLNKGRAMAAANDKRTDDTKRTHIAASAAAGAGASAPASIRQAAKACATSDSRVAAFIPREEFGLRMKT